MSIVSGKGGVGKTTTAANLGLALHKFGEQVVVVDGDMTASNLGLHLGFYSFPTKLQDVLRGEAHISQAIYAHPTGLKIIPSTLDIEEAEARLEDLDRVLHSLDGIVIVDAPAGLGRDVKQIMKASTEVLVVTSPELPTVANAVKAVRLASKYKKPVRGIVLNRFDEVPEGLTEEEVEMMCEAHVVAKIPFDQAVMDSVAARVPVVEASPYSPAAIEYKRLAAMLIGKVYQPPRFLFLRRLFG